MAVVGARDRAESVRGRHNNEGAEVVVGRGPLGPTRWSARLLFSISLATAAEADPENNRCPVTVCIHARSAVVMIRHAPTMVGGCLVDDPVINDTISKSSMLQSQPTQ